MVCRLGCMQACHGPCKHILMFTEATYNTIADRVAFTEATYSMIADRVDVIIRLPGVSLVCLEFVRHRVTKWVSRTCGLSVRGCGLRLKFMGRLPLSVWHEAGLTGLLGAARQGHHMLREVSVTYISLMLLGTTAADNLTPCSGQ